MTTFFISVHIGFPGQCIMINNFDNINKMFHKLSDISIGLYLYISDHLCKCFNHSSYYICAPWLPGKRNKT
jgi:hypothetical protein